MTHESETALSGTHPESQMLNAMGLARELRERAEWRAANEGPFTKENLIEWRAAEFLSAIHSQEAAAPSETGDAPENIIDNPKSWAAWKREADSWRRVAERLESEKQAASPAPVAVAPVGVRDLAWLPGGYPNTWDADTEIGRARIIYDERSFPEKAYGVCLAGEFKWLPSLEAAKAAAQADFNARILSSIIPAAKPAVGVGVGIGAAIAFVRKRCDEYVAEHGIYDPETGATEFPGNGDETVCEWEEIIEGLEAIRAALSRGTATPGGEKP